MAANVAAMLCAVELTSPARLIPLSFPWAFSREKTYLFGWYGRKFCRYASSPCSELRTPFTVCLRKPSRLKQLAGNEAALPFAISTLSDAQLHRGVLYELPFARWYVVSLKSPPPIQAEESTCGSNSTAPVAENRFAPCCATCTKPFSESLKRVLQCRMEPSPALMLRPPMDDSRAILRL
eukprot:880288-Rhodomonas_salina.1